MRHVVVSAFLVAGALLAIAGRAEAQALINFASPVVVPGASVTGTITGGTGGENFAVIGSTSNQGFSFAGVALAVGTDVSLVAVGTLDGSGSATVSFTPPVHLRDRFFVQLVTSPSPGFVPLTARNNWVLISSDVARYVWGIGGVVNAAGTLQNGTAGVTVTRLGVGQYRIDFPNLMSGPFVVSTDAIGGATLIGRTVAGSTATVTFSADTVFSFAATPRR